MHPQVRYEDHNRRLIIPKARLEDTGAYTCIVRSASNTATRTTYLGLQARPSFPYPLRNQHLDKGSDFTWRCSAVGVPVPTYTWFKNGKLLRTSTQDGITVKGNTLMITGVDSQHEGMYQCEARNSIGMARSSAQLRALSLPPTFAVTPVASSKQAAEGGEITIACRPQAAPRASIRWERNGAEVGTVLPNGDLHLTDLAVGDSGMYTCIATNDLGEERSSCYLTVKTNSVFVEEPDDREILVNESTTLPCRASFDSSQTDIVYTWTFNNHVIDFTGGNDDSATYSIPNVASRQDGILYITSAKYKHEGTYTCHVTSVTGSISSSAYVSVSGPPGEPGGVHVRGANNDRSLKGELELWWQKGSKHGFDVTYYIIEYRSVYDDRDAWKVLIDDLPDSETSLDEYPDWQGYMIRGGLSPGAAYHFRVTSCNVQVGCSPPSSGPYVYYRIAAAPPIHPPDNVGGGGGAEGLLQMKWDPLPRSKWGADFISYILYFRLKDGDPINGQWQKVKTNRTYHYAVVGLDFYYLQYTVKVQAFNIKGSGPNSTEAIVYSAEKLPEATPTFLSAGAVNATAGMVYWIPVPNTRETARGAVGGYQINYWQEGPQCRGGGDLEAGATSINIYGDVGEGLVIGLDAGSANCLNIQFYNAAGLGPKTDNYYLEMTWLPPKLYPEYVTVISHGRDSVRLFWKGVSTYFEEEPIRGYRVWYWEVTEDIRAARVVDFGMSQTGVIHGIERDMVYRLRMLAYSKGGNGTKSMDVFFTLGGQVTYDPLTTEIRNTAMKHPGTSLYLLSVILLVLHVVVLPPSDSFHQT
ncbi:contactin [Plakobranchus ocellatus]|uniref:Contactin n=1 Tax=Plakobranchus ocellatus TaxID=259542 RepID=A0AAV3ZJI0_9GAST|nr:contactin [Plakobranchus ocellatus]